MDNENEKMPKRKQNSKFYTFKIDDRYFLDNHKWWSVKKDRQPI